MIHFLAHGKNVKVERNILQVEHQKTICQMKQCKVGNVLQEILQTANSMQIWLIIFSGKGKTRHEAASSRAKSTPPTGARKAAATPAAAPQVIRSRLSRSFLKKRSHLQVKPYFLEPPWPSKFAMQAPVWTIGPSFPTTKPAATPKIEPNICHMHLVCVSFSFCLMLWHKRCRA